MSAVPGQCWGCRVSCWRSVADRDGTQHLLWPDPTAVFVVAAIERLPPEPMLGLSVTLAPGLPYCSICRPEVGDHPLACSERWPGSMVVDVKSATDRYAAWFTPEYRAWLAAWLRDHLRQDEDALLAQWDRDAGAEVSGR